MTDLGLKFFSLNFDEFENSAELKSFLSIDIIVLTISIWLIFII